MVQLSVIIPTYNEALHIRNTIEHIQSVASGEVLLEIIVVDGGSNDETFTITQTLNVKSYKAPKKGRAAQMNFGAAQATGEVFYFLHADTLPPKSFDLHIIQAVEKGKGAGSFRMQFTSKSWFLKLLTWFTKFRWTIANYGDQSLFVLEDVFKTIDGYDETMLLMEDNEIISHIKKQCKFTVIPKKVTTSNRRYIKNGALKLQTVFLLITIMYWLGFSQKRLMKVYRKWII
jgi:rSAM/selenodomain-associated transferase 2